MLISVFNYYATDAANIAYAYKKYIKISKSYNQVFVTNVAWIQPRNGYNQYYFTLDSTFFEAKLTRTKAGRGQMLEAKAEAEAKFLP